MVLMWIGLLATVSATPETDDDWRFCIDVLAQHQRALSLASNNRTVPSSPNNKQNRRQNPPMGIAVNQKLFRVVALIRINVALRVERQHETATAHNPDGMRGWDMLDLDGFKV